LGFKIEAATHQKVEDNRLDHNDPPFTHADAEIFGGQGGGKGEDDESEGSEV
jgi:hypothetical protein